MKRLRNIALIAVVFLTLVIAHGAFALAASPPPTILSYQGRLANSTGDLLGSISGTTYYFKFSVWDNPSVGSGAQVWPASAPTSVSSPVRQGVFNVNIGDTANGYPVPLTLDFSNYSALYLQVEVSSDNVTFETLSPRQQITAAAYAQLAGAVVGTTTQSAIGTTTPYGTSQLTLAATSSNATPLSIFGSASQAGNLLQIFSNTFSHLFSIDSGGGVHASSSLAVDGAVQLASLGNCTLKTDSNGNITCGIDIGGVGQELNWSFFNGSGLRLGTTTNQVLIGASSTSTLSKLEVHGGAFLDSATISGDFLTLGSTTLQNFTANNSTTTNATTTNFGIASIVSGKLLKTTTGGAVVAATAGTDFENPLTFNGPLSRSTNAISITQSGLGADGYLSSGDFTTFSNKLSSTSLQTSALLASLLSDETGTGSVVFGTNPSITGATLASTTLTGNFVFGNATGTNATTTNSFATTASSTNLFTGNLSISALNGILKATNGLVSAASAGSDYQVPLSFTYPLQNTSNTISLAFGTTTANAWSQLQTFAGGFLSTASTTIGNGTQAGGLTINGGATTTGNALVSGTFNVSGLSTLANLLLTGSTTLQNFTANNSTTTNATSTSLYTNLLGINSNYFSSLLGTGLINSAGVLTVSNVPNSALQNSTIGLSDSNSTLTIGGSPVALGGSLTATLNLGHSNNFTALQQFSGNASTTVLSALAAFFGSTATTTINGSGDLFVAGSTTLQNFTGVRATTTQATTTNLAISSVTSSLLKTLSNGAVVAAVAGSDYSNFTYPFPSNATSTLLTFGGGFLSTASTTIGNGTQAGGLTINGGATTTGNAFISGGLSINGQTILANASSTALSANTAFFGGSATSTFAVNGTLTTPGITISGITGSTQCLRVNSSGTISGTNSDCGSGSGTTNPGGSDTQVQFNDGGVFGADAGLTFNKSTGLLSAAHLLLTGSTTLQNFTFGNATGTSATTTNIFTSGFKSNTLAVGGTSTTSIDSGGNLLVQGGTSAGTSLDVNGTANALYYNVQGSQFIDNSKNANINSLNINSGNATIDSNGNATTSKLFSNLIAASSAFFGSSATTTINGAGDLFVAGSTTLQNFTFGNATGTAATTTSLAVIGQGTGCAQFNALGGLLSTGVACGSGGGAGFNFLSNYATTTAATTTALWAQSGIFASSTSHFVDASFTNATTTNFAITGLTGVLKSSAGGEVVAAVGGTDFENPLTFNGPLSRSTNAISITQSGLGTDGYLSSSDFTAFNNKVSSTSLSASSVLTYNSSTGNFTTAGGTFGSGNYIFPADLTVNGNATTTNLYANGTFGGAGLSACSTTADKLLWNASTRQFSCGTDSGASGSDVNWTHFNGSGIRVTTASDQVLIGFTSTSTLSKLEVVGGATIDNATTTNFYSGLVAVGNKLGIGTSSPISALTVAGGNITQVASGTPTLAATVAEVSGKHAYGTYVSGNYAYTADYEGGLKIIDISNPKQPTTVGSNSTYTISPTARAVVAAGKYAYVADENTGLVIFDVSKPNAPTVVGTYALGGTTQSLVLSGKYIYINDYNSHATRIIDVSNPTAPVLAGSYTSTAPLGLAVQGKYLYIADFTPAVYIVDISNPVAPALVGTYNGTNASSPTAVYVSGKYAYIADQDKGLYSLDVSNPSTPVAVGKYPVGAAHYFGVQVAGNYAYVTENNSGAATKIIDVSASTSLQLVGSISHAGTAKNLFVAGKYAYVADDSSGLDVVDINGIESPAANIGSLAANTVNISDTLNVGGDIYAGGGIAAGISGISSRGTISAFIASTTQANPVVATFIGGNVGIGTSTPFLPLSVAGSAFIGGNLTATGTLAVTGGTTLANATSTSFAVTGSSTISGVFNSVFANNLGSTTLSGNSLFTNATSTNFFSSTASSTNLFATNATFGALSASTLSLASQLSIANGGTNATSQTANGVTYFDGTKITSGTALTFDGTHLGIGTTTAAQLLTLSASDSGTSLTAAGLASISIINSNTTNNNTSDLVFKTADSAGSTVVGSKFATVFTDHTAGAVSADLALLTRNAGTLSEKLRITSAGNLGIGTTTPSQALSVQGNGLFSGNVFTANLNATGTLTGASIFALGSSTIGGGAQATGLTVSGGATTTGNLVVQGTGTSSISGTLAVSGSGTSTLANGVSISSGCFAMGTTCLTNFVNTLANGGTGTTTFYSGGVIFSDGTKLTQSAAQSDFFYDSTNKRLGLGTSTPSATLGINAIAGQASFAIGSSTGSYFVVDSIGRVGIGTSTPSSKLAVSNTASAAQTTIAYDQTDFAKLYVNSTGDFFTQTSGQDDIFNNDNLWVCTGGSDITVNNCPAGTPTGQGNLIIENKLGLGTTTPAAKLTIETQDNTTNFFQIGSTTNQNLFNINANGNVGIGTSTPFSKLAVGPGGAIVTTENSVADSGTISIDWRQGNQQTVTLGGNRTINFTNYISGEILRLIVCQDATGNRTVTWDSKVMWSGGQSPNLTSTAGYCDLMAMVASNATGTTPIILGSSVLNFP